MQMPGKLGFTVKKVKTQSPLAISPSHSIEGSHNRMPCSLKGLKSETPALKSTCRAWIRGKRRMAVGA